MSVRRLALLSALVLAGCAEQQPTEPALTPDATVSLHEDRSASPPSTTVVLSNLDSPRGLDFGPDGALYVVEAGNTTINGPCVAVARGQNCFSGTGAVTRLWHGRQSRVASGLPSVFNPATLDITGPHHVEFRGFGSAQVTIGWGANPSLRSALGEAGEGFGHLIQLLPNGRWRVVADVSAVEADENPAGGPVDSNPYGLLSDLGRRYVTDAGGNSLIEVKGDGQASVVATFGPTPAPPPFLQSEAVPTQVRRGPDGALYVSTLTGVPFVDGSAGIYRVVPGQAPVLYAGGFKAITDFAFGPRGDLYVVEYASGPVFFGGPGRLLHVDRDGTRTVLNATLHFPTGVAVGPDGAVYVSNNGSLAGVGEVLRIVP